MLRVLVVTDSTKTEKNLRDFLCNTTEVSFESCDATQALLFLKKKVDVDLCILHVPFLEINFHVLVQRFLEKTRAQVLLLTSSDPSSISHFKQQGVVVLQKPIGKQTFLSTIELILAVQTRNRKITEEENVQFHQKIDELRLFHRAKCVLISSLGMTESQAHRHMEQQAMNQRRTKAEIAINLLKIYESL